MKFRKKQPVEPIQEAKQEEKEIQKVDDFTIGNLKQDISRADTAGAAIDQELAQLAQQEQDAMAGQDVSTLEKIWARRKAIDAEKQTLEAKKEKAIAALTAEGQQAIDAWSSEYEGLVAAAAGERAQLEQQVSLLTSQLATALRGLESHPANVTSRVNALDQKRQALFTTYSGATLSPRVFNAIVEAQALTPHDRERIFGKHLDELRKVWPLALNRVPLW